MGLKEYKQKRDFKQSPEPTESRRSSPSGNPPLFVVQRHHASRLHYDLRIEWKGKLLSWAVPKGPSMNPSDKRLAVQVEDHPLSYADFEGTIPEGNYGAGMVSIWDQGTYQPVDTDSEAISSRQFAKDLKEGSIKIRLNGKKLKGEFALVRMKKEEKNWLLIKHHDRYATQKDYDSESLASKNALEYTKKKSSNKKETPKESSKTSRKKKVQADRRISLGTPDKPIRPMLAQADGQPFDDPNWIFELKWDGYRAIAEISSHGIALYSRNGTSFAKRFPSIIEALNQGFPSMVIDGEIVAVDEHGISRFSLIQPEGFSSSTDLLYYVFDLLEYEGESLREQPLTDRKAKLKRVLPENSRIRYVDHIEKNGTPFFQALKNQGLEGLIAKRKDSLYREGSRSTSWLKIKNQQTEEAVIAGFTKSRSMAAEFGALVLGVYQEDRLVYIGHTGTGFSLRTMKALHKRLLALETDQNPFGKKVKLNNPVTWVKPELVCQISYTEITESGSRRHPVFLGLREDKDPREVKGERLQSGPASTENRTQKSLSMNQKKQPRKSVKLTNLDKVYWPDQPYLKRDLIEYYSAIYKYIIPYLRDRPQSMKRHPDGIHGKSFYHKDAGEQAPSWLDTYADWSETSQKTVHYLLCNNKPSLRYMANLGCIEINPWHSRTQQPDYPDYLVLDLDPSEKNRFSQVVDVALTIREILEKLDVKSYCKTSGATGLHVYLPLGTQYTYKQARQFAQIIMTRVNEWMPDSTTLERSLKKRKKDQIYLDYLQNKEGATLASAYSLRPLPGAPVSTPLEWKELNSNLDPLQFNIKNIEKRLSKKGDLWAPVLKRGIDMKKILDRW